MPAPEINSENQPASEENLLFQEGYRRGREVGFKEGFEVGTETLRERTRTKLTVVLGSAQLLVRDNGNFFKFFKRIKRRKWAVETIEKATTDIVRMFETPEESSNNGNNDQTPPDSSP